MDVSMKFSLIRTTEVQLIKEKFSSIIFRNFSLDSNFVVFTSVAV